MLISIIAFTVPVSQDMAGRVAQNWTAKWAPQDFNNRAVEKIIPFNNKSEAQLYLFQYNDGFVLTSADDAIVPVLAYGFDTTIGKIDDNPAFREYVATLQQEITQIKADNLQNTDTAAQWQDIISNNFQRNETRNVTPLCATTWNQGWPYNMYCPADAAGSGGHVYAGCVATAMGQVMKYWNWPNTGVGSHTYNAYGYGNQTANFGQTTYQWSQMPNAVHEPNAEVAKLLYHLGVSVDMMYSPDGSGAYSADVVPALINNFRYNPGTQIKSKNNFNSATWEQMLRDELDSARPMYYSGSGPAGGHAFVCDGYQGTNYFHFNWGWSGSYDGYFYVSNLNPGSTFNNYQSAIFNVYPVNYNASSVQMTLQSMDCSVGDNVPVSVITYPILPDWNVTVMSFVIEYDHENMAFIDYEATGTMLEGSVINTNPIQPGSIAFTVNSSSAITGAGTLLKINFQPLIPGNFAFNMAQVSMNSSPVTLLNPTTINVTATVMEPQNSVIDLLNVMYVSYNEIASVPLTTTFVLPTWNVTSASFTLHYPSNQVTWEGYDMVGSLSENAVIQVANNGLGALTFNLNYSGNLVGIGNLLKLNFRATGNVGNVSLVTLTVSDFFFNSIPVLNLQPGYIVLLPVTANEENVTPVETKLNYGPNPFQTHTNLSLQLVKPNQKAEINIYNMKGQLIRTLFNSDLKGSQLDLTWNGRDNQDKIVPAGIYLARIKSADFNKAFKLIKLK